jgi:AraC-like DNA-binding protein
LSQTAMLENVHIQLVASHFVTINPLRWRFQNVQSSFWRLYMNNRDGAFLERTEDQIDRPYPLDKGRLYVIPAGVRFNTRSTCPVGHLYVHFDVIGLPYIALREMFNEPICLPHRAALEEEAWALMHALEIARSEEDLILQFRIKALLYEGLALYLQSVPPEQLQCCLQLAVALEPVLPAIRHIENHLASRLLISDLAQLCHMNEDYFIRRFRECVGQTPGQYIQAQRVKMAERLLLFTDHSIAQIAERTGFGNRFYFSRVFAQHASVSPVAYRKGARGL